MCNYPKCKKESVIEFALVGLCKEHYLDIYNESKLYYENKLANRPYYDLIKHLAENQKKLVKEEDVYGADCRSGQCEV